MERWMMEHLCPVPTTTATTTCHKSSFGETGWAPSASTHLVVRNKFREIGDTLGRDGFFQHFDDGRVTGLEPLQKAENEGGPRRGETRDEGGNGIAD